MIYKATTRFKKDLSLLTNAAIDTLTDAVLYVTFNALTGMGARTMREFDYSLYQADILLSRYNSKTIRKTLHNLVSRRYIRRKNTKTGFELSITQSGIKRIHEIIPTFKEKRPWNGYLYLVSYDIPIESNRKRDILREYLRKIGCGKLQDSLWMTPYYPAGIIDSFVNSHNVPGTILVSKLGKDGTIGDEDRNALIDRVYGYNKLKDRYDEFIRKYQNQEHLSKTQLSLDYYAVLKDDPQLPFVLEPKEFPARQANRLFQLLLSS